MTLTKPFTKPILDFLNNLRKTKSSRNNFILYKIVDSSVRKGEELHIVQCINTKAVLFMSIPDIVFDVDILYGLHPIQGCYVGIEYSQLDLNSQTAKKQSHYFSQYSTHRYGNKNLLYQNRDGLLGFECKATNTQSLMDPRDIALSRSLIQEFDAVQAFCIGVLAGLKFSHSQIERQRYNKKQLKNHLRLVGGSQREPYFAETNVN